MSKKTKDTKERPIIFSGEMVRAIIDGRKTQTRRVVRPQPEMIPQGAMLRSCGVWEILIGADNLAVTTADCPHGVTGDRRWVRESFQAAPGGGYWYKADDRYDYPCPEGYVSAWKPSTHMPRRASRILLEIASVRVERVQEISEEDIDAEGTWFPGKRPENGDPRLGFEMLWNLINAKRGFGWDVNPWVWVIEFKRVEASERSEAR